MMAIISTLLMIACVCKLSVHFTNDPPYKGVAFYLPVLVLISVPFLFS